MLTKSLRGVPGYLRYLSPCRWNRYMYQKHIHTGICNPCSVECPNTPPPDYPLHRPTPSQEQFSRQLTLETFHPNTNCLLEGKKPQDSSAGRPEGKLNQKNHAQQRSNPAASQRERLADRHRPRPLERDHHRASSSRHQGQASRVRSGRGEYCSAVGSRLMGATNCSPTVRAPPLALVVLLTCTNIYHERGDADIFCADNEKQPLLSLASPILVRRERQHSRRPARQLDGGLDLSLYTLVVHGSV